MFEFQVEDSDTAVLALLITILLSNRRTADDLAWLAGFTGLIASCFVLIAVESAQREKQVKDIEKEITNTTIAALKNDIEKLNQEIQALKSSSKNLCY